MRGLNKLYYFKIEIEELKEEIKNLAEISSPIITGMPGSNKVSNPPEEHFMKKQRLIEKLNRKLERYFDELERIESVIDGIEDAEIRTIARMRFVRNLKWEEIGKLTGYDRSVCYKKMNKYLKGMENGK